jgi:hypothetical protein
MKNVPLSQIAIGAAAGAALVVAGVAIGAAVDDGGRGAAFEPAAQEVESRDGPRFGGRPGGALADPQVRAVLEEIREAVARKASAIADPILDEAVKDGKIDKDQADRIRERLGDRRGRGLPFPPRLRRDGPDGLPAPPRLRRDGPDGRPPGHGPRLPPGID